jgi:hypothetical protein
MFKVYHFSTNEEFTVYGVSDTQQGVPMFLLYIDNTFTWRFANDYIPVI